jgi:hypothetical protein
MDPQPAAPEPMDISQRTLIVLVLLSCVISIVGTVAMIYEFSNARAAPLIIENGGASAAEAGFTINGQLPPQAPQSTGATGFATFQIGE